LANAATTPPQGFNWRMPAGFIFGLGLILASAAFTISTITGLPFSAPVISAIFIGLTAAYFVHAFTVTFWIYIGAIVIAVFWPDTFLLQFPGTLVAGLLDGAPHRDPPELVPGEALAGGILCCLIVGMFSIRRRDNFQGPLLFSFMGLFALGEILRVFITFGFNSGTLGYASVIAVCGGVPALASYLSSRRDPEHRFSAMWSKTAFFDSAFTRYVISRAPSIFLIVMLYLYVVVSFAAVYFYIDNCNHQERFCRLIVQWFSR
jgi:hypothetical protein